MIKNKKVYGFSYPDDVDYDKIDEKYFVIMDLYEERIFNKVKVPGKPSFQSHRVDLKGKFVYITSDEGVYRKKEKANRWVEIMDNQYSENYLYAETVLLDITVANKKKLYITFINKKDQPVLIRYTDK